MDGANRSTIDPRADAADHIGRVFLTLPALANLTAICNVDQAVGCACHPLA